MRKPIILALVCLVAFVAVLAFAGSSGKTDTSNPNVPTPTWLALLGSLTSPFANNAVLPQTKLSLLPAAPVSLSVPKSDDDMRIARFEIAGAGAVQIRYTCQGSNAKDCNQIACLGGTPAPVRPPVAGCTDHNACWRPDVAIRVFKGGGILTFTAFDTPAAVEQVKRSTKAAGSNCGSH
jgi:hypothetical protein